MNQSNNRVFELTREPQWRNLAIITATGALAAYWSYKKFSSRTAPELKRLVELQQDAAAALRDLSPTEQEEAANRAAEITDANLSAWGEE
jgi:hypothetical protein